MISKRPRSLGRARASLRALSATFAVGAAVFGADVARAQTEIPVLAQPSPRIRVDGWLREWSTGSFATVGLDTGARVRVALSANDRGLFVAASVDDDRFVRTGRPAASEDALVVSVAMPTSNDTLAATEIWLYAGVPNEVGAVLSVGGPDATGRAPRDASIVEMPTASGYDLEAFVPWSALPGRDYARGRVVVRLSDVDAAGGAAREVRSMPSWPAAPGAWPRVVGSAGELFPLTAFLRARSARWSDVEHDLRANVSGDATHERLVVAKGMLAVLGTAYANGREFDYADIGGSRGNVHDPRVVDFDGDGRKELVCVVARREGELEVRELRVFQFPGEGITPIFRAELSLGAAGAPAGATYTIDEAGGGPPTITIPSATGAPPRAAHVPAPGAEPMVYASSGVVARRYRWAGRMFDLVEEVRPEVAAPAPAGRARPGASQPAPATRPANASTPPAASTPPPATTQPAPRTGGFSPAPLYTAILRERGLPESTRARFETQSDVAEDARPELLAVLGRSLVITGPGFRSGMGYFALDLDVPDDAAIVGLSSVDVTGDAKAEILLRVRQPVGTSPFSLELLVVYRLVGQDLAPIFTAQVGISDGTRSVRNEPRVIGSGRTVQLAIAPGRAEGVDARTFPFTSTATPGMATLLLPWRDTERRYRWNGRELVGA